MIYLFLTILTNAIIFLLFKWFEKFNVHLLVALIINYVIASSVGFMINGGVPENWMLKPWFLGSVFTGFLFISIFYLIALTSQKISPSIASVSNKMSVAIPVTVAFILYHDRVTVLKISGIVLAILGIVLVAGNLKLQYEKSWHKFLPVLLFLSNGFLDSFFNYQEKIWVAPHEIGQFVSSVFFFAFIFGIVGLSGETIRKKTLSFDLKTVLGGIILGSVNYFSILFLMKSLKFSGLESSVVYPLVNVGIVLVTIMMSMAVFKERFTLRQWVGVSLCIVAIVMITYA